MTEPAVLDCLSVVHQPPGGQATLYQNSNRYDDLLARKFGEKFLKYRQNWNLASQRSDPGVFPLSLDLAVNSGCQLSCLMCPLPANPRHSRYAPMDQALFLSLMAQAKEHELPALTLGLASEPLLNPKIAQCVHLAGQAGVMDIRLGTNGQALTKTLIDSLLDSPLTRLEISLDAMDPSTYARIRVGGDYFRLLKAIDHFLSKRAANGQDMPLLRLSFLTLPMNRKQLPLFFEKYGSLVDMLSIQKPITFPGARLEQLQPSEKSSTGLLTRETNGEADDSDKSGGKRPKTLREASSADASRADQSTGRSSPSPNGRRFEKTSPAPWRDDYDETSFCLQPWQRLAVDAAGHIWPCCNWYGEDLLSLKATDADISDIWRSKSLNRLREKHRRNDFPEQCRLCRQSGGF
jgi:radical SAM protein with 4Fe4S-binding SPASM domain